VYAESILGHGIEVGREAIAYSRFAAGTTEAPMNVESEFGGDVRAR
jgi:hypothetical protein